MAKFKIGNACKKCGERGASVRYDTIPGLEVMHRVCKLCGYSWVEEPLNTQTSEKNLADSSQAVQHLKAEIAAIAEEIKFNLSNACISNMTDIKQRLQQLAAVE